MAVRLKTKNEPTRRTLELLAAKGWTADIVERRTGRISRDWCGCIDIIAVHPALQVVSFIQVTSWQHVGERVTKVKAEPRIADVLKAGGRVEVWGWKPEMLQPRIVRVSLD